MSASSVYSQTSENSTPQTSNRATLVSLCDAAKEEVKILRPLYLAAKENYESGKQALDDERRAGTLTGEQLAERTREVESLRVAYEKMKRGFDEKTAEVEVYKKALKGAIKKKNFFKNLAKYSTTAAAVLAAIVVLQNKN